MIPQALTEAEADQERTLLIAECAGRLLCEARERELALRDARVRNIDDYPEKVLAAAGE